MKPTTFLPAVLGSLFRKIRFLCMGMLLLGSAISAQAQVRGDFSNADEPVLLGSFSVLPNSPKTGVDVFSGNDDLDLFVEGPIRINAMVHKQNLANQRVTGDPFLPTLNGTVTLRGKRFKVTSRTLVEAVLAQNGIDDIRGYQLLWRGYANSLSKGFQEKVGGTNFRPVVVGIRGRLLRYDATDFFDLHFSGAGGQTDRSLIETGFYGIRPDASGMVLRRERGNRSGFIDMSGTLMAPLPGAVVDEFYVTGIFSIRRTLRTLPMNPFLGQDFGGKTYERGRITGRLLGYYQEP